MHIHVFMPPVGRRWYFIKVCLCFVYVPSPVQQLASMQSNIDVLVITKRSYGDVLECPLLQPDTWHDQIYMQACYLPQQ